MPGLKIVVGHLKSDGLFEEQLELMRRFENVCFDISAFATDKDGTLRYAVDRVGSERILFGTDYPGVNPAGDIAAVLAEKLSFSEKENIFFKNAEKLLF
jgi:predicted TIM-barrel fold metal-dependent hydrolase